MGRSTDKQRFVVFRQQKQAAVSHFKRNNQFPPTQQENIEPTPTLSLMHTHRHTDACSMSILLVVLETVIPNATNSNHTLISIAVYCSTLNAKAKGGEEGLINLDPAHK